MLYGGLGLTHGQRVMALEAFEVDRQGPKARVGRVPPGLGDEGRDLIPPLSLGQELGLYAP